MADYSYTLYDTAIFGTVVNFENVLFQVAQGGDAVHTEAFTNSRGAGVLPTEEKFVVKKIHAIVDVNALVANVINMNYSTFVEVRVKDLTVFKCPIALLWSRSAYSGFYTQAAAAEEQAIGLLGNGYELEIPITIMGGTAFRVRVVQGVALTVVAQNIKIVLDGTLSMP